MPRITETLKQELDDAFTHYYEQNDRMGGIQVNLVQTRALIEIADSLKGIESHLATLIETFAPIADRTALEQAKPAARSRKKGEA